MMIHFPANIISYLFISSAKTLPFWTELQKNDSFFIDKKNANFLTCTDFSLKNAILNIESMISRVVTDEIYATVYK